MAVDTELDDLRALLDRQRAAFQRDGRPPLGTRRAGLGRLRAALISRGDDLVQAVSADFCTRSPRETRFLEVAAGVGAIDEALAHLEEWMQPLGVPTPALLGAATSVVTAEPRGVAGIIVPWNYPVGLAISPLVASLAAGNRVMLKPSASTPRTAAVLKALAADVFGDEQVAVVSGGPGLGGRFAGLPFDHLFFTGSTAVGRAVMRAAADHLVPVTLELGGKCPVLVAADIPLDRVAAPVAWGKTLSAGQTCVAPDYALVDRGRAGAFASLLQETLARAYPTVGSNPDYTALISGREAARVRALIADAAARGATIVEVNPAQEHLADGDSKIPPTLVLDATMEMAIMQEEIFGPVLPIVSYDGLDEAIAFVNARPRPLALYLFSDDDAVKERVLARTSSGGVTINGVMSHMLQEHLPFGGVGASGLGSYHGRWGFMTFSHLKPVLDHGTGRRPTDRLAAPYGPFFDRAVDTMLRPA